MKEDVLDIIKRAIEDGRTSNTYSEEEKIRAAYALNMCMVSVSQIIDYDDMNVLDQEYEGILNNLNIEMMPKDESLLIIIKRILDTITFFKMEEGDKKMLEKEYQHQMKNAIWSAIPNIGVIVTSGNPAAIVTSLATQVGIGYMNYRRNKSQLELEKEKQLWKMQRSAMEQFNGLRRELFDTAWRLADTYNFPDEYRLTERQIHQYNEILMDCDLIRKYERLDAIKDKFIAYPPFWYHFGNTASLIADDEYLDLDDDVKKEFKDLAIANYRQYRVSNQQGLLREDPISSACALELVDLLDINADREEMEGLIDEAVRTSGNANDILQLAVMAYLKIDNQDKAIKILRILVNEQYNTVLNSQILSSIYVTRYMETQNVDIKRKYEILIRQVGEGYLYPMPELLDENIDELDKQFIETQKRILEEKYLLVMEKYIEKYTVKYGMIIPVMNEKGEIPYSYYLEEDDAIDQRKADIRKIFASNKRSKEYKYYWEDKEICNEIIDVLNSMFNGLCCLDPMSEVVQNRLVRSLQENIVKSKKRIEVIQSGIQNKKVDANLICDLLDIKFSSIIGDFLIDFNNEVKKYIEARESMQDFAIAESNLTEFCQNEGLPSPEKLYGKDGEEAQIEHKILEDRFSVDLFDTNFTLEELSSVIEKKKELIRNAIPYLRTTALKVEIFSSDDPRTDRYFESNKKLALDVVLKGRTLAILDDKEDKGDFDLIFTTKGIVPVRDGVVKKTVPYEEVEYYPEKAKLIIGTAFTNRNVNLKKLFDLIQELKDNECNKEETSYKSIFAIRSLRKD